MENKYKNNLQEKKIIKLTLFNQVTFVATITFFIIYTVLNIFEKMNIGIVESLLFGLIIGLLTGNYLLWSLGFYKNLKYNQ